jgi:hypothetical protein
MKEVFKSKTDGEPKPIKKEMIGQRTPEEKKRKKETELRKGCLIY